MSKRRGHGEGSIYFDGIYWRGVIDLGVVKGKRVRRYVQGRTQKEAGQKLQDLRRDLAEGRILLVRDTLLREFLSAWLNEVVRPVLAPRTAEHYAWAIDNHLIPKLGEIKVSKLSTQQVHRFVSELQSETVLSVRSIEAVWQTLKRSLKVAVQWGLATRNVAEDVRPRRPRPKEVEPFSVGDMLKIIAASETDPLGAAFAIALFCGLRRGEILGLTWASVALDATVPTLSVRQQVQRVGGVLTVSEPKSAKSKRTIAIPKLVVLSLRRHRARQAEARLTVGAAWADHGLVFPNALGLLSDPRHLHRRWTLTLAAAGLPHRPLHDARHSAASLLISEGLPVNLVADTLGHSTARLTLDTYAHLMPGDRERIAGTIDRVLGNGL